MKTRSKLMAALAMLLVSTIMMTTASFAWFTISTAPEISNISAQATANGNLEIALYSAAGPGNSALGDAGDNTKWGNLIDLSNAFTTTPELKPVQLDGTAIKIPQFGLDGRLKADLAAAVETGDGGVVTYTDTAGTVWAIGIKFYLRSNESGNVTLTTDGIARGAGENGLGTNLDTENAGIKVAFVAGDAVAATLTKDTVPTGTIVTLDGDSANGTLVTAILYMDGEGMTNKDFANAAQSVNLNIQFVHSTTLDGMDVTGTDHGRTTPANGGSDGDTV